MLKEKPARPANVDDASLYRVRPASALLFLVPDLSMLGYLAGRHAALKG